MLIHYLNINHAYIPLSACSKGTWGLNCSQVCQCLDAKTDCDPVAGCTECNEGFTGGDCQQDVDECTETPGICGDNADCTNKYGFYTCICDYGYEWVLDSCECKCDEICYCIQNNVYNMT